MLFGEVSPSGRLPLTLPQSETGGAQPCWEPHCIYTEGLHGGWRGLIGSPVAFEFGFGLSYTTFTHRWSRAPPDLVNEVPSTLEVDAGADEGGSSEGKSRVALEIDVVVENSGSLPGSEVVQLYLSYPPAANEPALVMRDFRKTPTLEPGQQATIRFALTVEALSVWNAQLDGGNGDWQRVSGTFTAVVGQSSRNHTLTHSFSV